MKYLGIDWGQSRIGLAVAESEIRIASPFKVVSNIKEVLQIIQKEKIEKIILGKPYTKPPSSQGVLETEKDFNQFKNILLRKTNIPLKLFDERLTTKAANALPGDKKTKAPLDAVAAMLILQGYLDLM